MLKDDLNLSIDESINTEKENIEDYSAKALLEKVIEESDSQPYRGDNIGSRD